MWSGQNVLSKKNWVWRESELGQQEIWVSWTVRGAGYEWAILKRVKAIFGVVVFREAWRRSKKKKSKKIEIFWERLLKRHFWEIRRDSPGMTSFTSSCFHTILLIYGLFMLVATSLSCYFFSLAWDCWKSVVFALF